MANKRARPDLATTSGLVGLYVVIVLATLVALTVLAATAPDLATPEAWGHAVVVAVFAVLLPLRLRVARRGSRRALTAVGVIAVVLALVNLVEAFLPAFPGWMRAEMVVVAALMAAVGVLVTRARGRATMAG
ncbi:hypothetical protein GCM10023201_31750 [Actinomycetospora corticicola]|uniref:Putative membrane protein n=1 Tax=Actinomycetospora corticicola TaxID=663602 RepID=A0A7Y9DUE4_9PSEU|nr:hypothetical protein [Actinomycetospora corticicola]NYD35697.1 putative membrane protein [Actinomycetospora corticicola]